MFSITNVSKAIEGKSIINSLSFNIKKGDILGLLGPNGAGKTTTIKLMMGLIHIDQGNIEINGKSLVEEKGEYLRDIGYVPDEPFFYEELTGLEFMNFTTKLKEDIVNDSILTNIIDRLRMEEFLKQPIHTYSYGMKRKLSIALALIHQPSLLIMDEPFNGVDPVTVNNIKQLLKSYTSKGNSVLISTHAIDSVEKLCSSIAVIKKGEMLLFGDLDEILKKQPEKDLEDLVISLME